MRPPAGARPVAVTLMIALVALVSGCGGAGAGGEASTGPGFTSSALRDDQGFTLAPPPVPEGEPVLLTSHGFGAHPASDPTKVDGSYTIYAACQGGSEVTVVSTATRSETRVACSGYTSRLRYLTASTTESWEVKAAKDQEWVLRMVDAPKPE